MVADGWPVRRAAWLLIVTLLLVCATATEGTYAGGRFSNTANEFHVGFMQNYVDSFLSAYSYFVLNRSTLFITTDEANDVATCVTYGGLEHIHIVEPGVVTKIRLVDMRADGPADRNKGVHIKAEGESAVSVFTMDEELYSLEGYSAFPCTWIPHVAQYEYYAMSAPRTNTVANMTADSAFLVVACDDNTTVTVTPTQTTVHPDDPFLKIKAGESFQVTLHKSQTLYVESRDDLTGSLVVSDNPVTFLSGHECGNIPYNVAECNKLTEQLPPTLTWGTEFLTAPTASRNSSDIIKVLAAEDNTEVAIACTLKNGTFSTNTSATIGTAGQSINFTTSPDEFCHIHSDKAVLVVQFTPGHGADPSEKSRGDPFMVLVPAVSQYLNNITFTLLNGPALLFENHVNLFVSADDFDYESVQLDGAPINRQSWVSIQCVSWGICGYAAQVQVSSDDGVHQLEHTSPNATLGITVYGIEGHHTLAYAYVGGLKLSNREDPMIVEPAQTSFMILSGRSICFTCELTASYFDPSLVQWEFHGSQTALGSRRVRKLSNGTLCVSNANASDSGKYTCSIGSDTLTYTLSVIAGILVQPPTCRPQPATNQTVLLGVGTSQSATNVDQRVTSVELCCVTTLTVERVTWLVNGEEILRGHIGYEVGTDYLHIRGPFTDKCVVYTCQATFGGDVFKESSEVCYGRFGPPRSLRISGQRKALEGNSLTVECSASGFPTPVLAWKVDQQLEASLPSHAHDFGNGTLLLEAVYETARYCCVAANERGTASACTDIVVLVPPEIQQPADHTPLIIPVPPGVPLPLPYNITVTADIGQRVTVVETYRLEIHCMVTRGNPEPTISWLHNGVPISTQDYQVVSEGSGEVLLVEAVAPTRDNGTFTCVVEIDGVGSANRTSTVTVTEPPRIADPLPPLHVPGNCRDLTDTPIASSRVGVNLCVLASPESRFYLDCITEKGFPAPTVQWYKDGEEMNSTNTSTHEIFSNGTLLLKAMLHPIESAATGDFDTMGTYTCFLSNIAGTANSSSYIVPFGDISPEAAAYYAPIQMELFDQLHQHMSTSTPEHDENLVLVTASGKLLRYDDYYPGRNFDGGEDTVPPHIMENMFDLVDIIPDGSRVVVTDDHTKDSLSMTYEYLLGELMVAPPDADYDSLTEARNQLQELVTDIAGKTNRTLPRLSLYLLYKNRYYQKKLDVENQIEYQQRRLPGLRFSQWYERNGAILENEVKHAYYEWDVFGSKNETEVWLDVLNLQDHSRPLDEARSILFATTKTSKYKDEKLYYPVDFYPDYWFDILRNKVQESIEQLQYELAELQSQKKALEFTTEFLETELRRRTLGFWERPPPVYSQLEAAAFILEHGVMSSEQQRYQCLVTRNPVDCQLYSYEYNLVVQLMEIFADLYWEAEFVKTATDHRDVSIPLVVSAISSIEEEIEQLDLIIRVSLLQSAERDVEDETTETEFEGAFTNFVFNTKGVGQKQYDFMVSDDIGTRPLWYIDPLSTSLTPTKELEEYSRALSHLNSMWTNVTAKFVEIDVHRRWFKPGLFGDNHLKLRNEDILVSPGLVRPWKDMRLLLTNNTYKLPLYPSSLILATDVEIFVSLPFPFHTLPSLLRLSYDQHVYGGFGPFSFGPLFKGKTRGIKFQVQVRDNGVVIVLPGAQLIGYICNVVPKHPSDFQLSSNRRRRSTAQPLDDGGRRGLSSSRFGQWLRRGTKMDASDGHQPGRQVENNGSTYSQRLQRALSLEKPQLSGQAETFTVYANTSVEFAHADLVYERKEQGVRKKRSRYV